MSSLNMQIEEPKKKNRKSKGSRYSFFFGNLCCYSKLRFIKLQLNRILDMILVLVIAHFEKPCSKPTFLKIISTLICIKMFFVCDDARGGAEQHQKPEILLFYIFKYEI